jgi:ribosomal protein S18 acetylase RimI-like enzyme
MEDLDAAYRVCLETGAFFCIVVAAFLLFCFALFFFWVVFSLLRVLIIPGNGGADGTHLYKDPRVLGRRWTGNFVNFSSPSSSLFDLTPLFPGPYLQLEPSLAWVLEDELGVCGYVLGARDTKAFWERYVTEWVPEMKTLYPSCPPASDTSPDANVIRSFYAPHLHFPEEWSIQYPSHLHIDLVARAQGRGLGTTMIQTLLSELRRQGSAGVHLEMGLNNVKALKFYEKMGFKELQRDEKEEDLFLGLKFVP